jgi:hypothetical protein
VQGVGATRSLARITPLRINAVIYRQEAGGTSAVEEVEEDRLVAVLKRGRSAFAKPRRRTEFASRQRSDVRGVQVESSRRTCSPQERLCDALKSVDAETPGSEGHAADPAIVAPTASCRTAAPSQSAGTRRLLSSRTGC